jgi:hypothetical protein
MRKFHHYGIPTKEIRKDEALVEAGGFKFYSTPFEANKWHIQWHRFPKGHGLPELITRVPHIAFQVDDLDKEIQGANILFGPYIVIPVERHLKQTDSNHLKSNKKFGSILI